MHNSLAAYRSQLFQSKCYIPSPHFLQSVRWQYEDTGHVLVDTSMSSNFVVVVVGRVLEHRLYCAPNSNYLVSDSESKFGNLSTAKFQLQLGRPIGTVFAMAFDKVLENAAKVQAQLASTQDRRNFLISDGGIWNLRFTCKIFEKCVRIPIPFTRTICLIVFLQDHIITELPDLYQDEFADVDMQG